MDDDFELEEERRERLERLEEELIRVKRGLWYRVAFLVFILISGTYGLLKVGPGVLYFMKFNEEPLDLGDARRKVAKGKRFLDLPSNTYVKVRNLIVSRPAKTRNYKYFYSPLFNMIVRTKRDVVPSEVPAGTMRIPKGLAFLVQERIIFLSDFATHFDAEGRLIRLEDFPGWKKGLRALYEKPIKKMGGPGYILLDGDTPGSHIWDVVVVASFVVAFLFALFMTLRQHRLVKFAQEDWAKAAGLGGL